MKIYIVGPVGSGKTTFAKKLSNALDIPYYELDNICWKPNGDGKRNEKEVNKLFSKILSCRNWIIENVGSDFEKGFEQADIIIYLNISRLIVHKRIIIRGIKRFFGIEKSPFKNNIRTLINELKWADKELNSKNKLNKVKSYGKKLVILDEKGVKKYKYNLMKIWSSSWLVSKIIKGF